MKSSTNIVHFYICKLFVTFLSTLSSITALTYTTRRERVIWFDELVDETHTASDLINHLLSMLLWKHLSTKPILALIRYFYCMLFISCSEKSKYWTKHFLIVNLFAITALNDCNGIKWSLHILSLPKNLITFWKLFDLLI